MLNYRFATGEEAIQLFAFCNDAIIEGSNALEMDICHHIGLADYFLNPEVKDEEGNVIPSEPLPEDLNVLGFLMDTHIARPILAGGDIWDMYKTYHCAWMVYTAGGNMYVQAVYILLDSKEGDADPSYVPEVEQPSDPLLEKFNRQN